MGDPHLGSVDKGSGLLGIFVSGRGVPAVQHSISHVCRSNLLNAGRVVNYNSPLKGIGARDIYKDFYVDLYNICV